MGGILNSSMLSPPPVGHINCFHKMALQFWLQLYQPVPFTCVDLILCLFKCVIVDPFSVFKETFHLWWLDGWLPGVQNMPPRLQLSRCILNKLSEFPEYSHVQITT